MHADDAAPPLGRGIGCWRHPGACVSLRLSNGRESNAPSLASLSLSIASRGGGGRGAADARLLCVGRRGDGRSRRALATLCCRKILIDLKACTL